MHTYYVAFWKCTLRIFIPLEIYDYRRLFQHVIRNRGFPNIMVFQSRKLF